MTGDLRKTRFTCTDGGRRVRPLCMCVAVFLFVRALLGEDDRAAGIQRLVGMRTWDISASFSANKQYEVIS